MVKSKQGFQRKNLLYEYKYAIHKGNCVYPMAKHYKLYHRSNVNSLRSMVTEKVVTGETEKVINIIM